MDCPHCTHYVCTQLPYISGYKHPGPHAPQVEPQTYIISQCMKLNLNISLSKNDINYNYRMYPNISHTTTSKPRPNHFLFKNIQIIQPSTSKFFAMSPFLMNYRFQKYVTLQGLLMNQLLSFSHHLLPWSYKIYKKQKVYPSDILSSGSQFCHKYYS